jgi:hypothetical protein
MIYLSEKCSAPFFSNFKAVRELVLEQARRCSAIFGYACLELTNDGIRAESYLGIIQSKFAWRK